MKDFEGKVAVVTGAASGVGFAICQALGARGAKLVMADVQADALALAAERLQSVGAKVLTEVTDVSNADAVASLAQRTLSEWGVPHLVFNNAGVSAGGLVWESTDEDWRWVLGVNLMGVVHGVRVFAPLMLAAAKDDPLYEAHIVNTASMSGLVNAPNMGAYNVSKHAVVALSETLYHDLRLVTTQVGASVLCPSFVQTAIADSARNRPDALACPLPATKSQRINRLMATRAVKEASVSADDIALATLDAIAAKRFYVHGPMLAEDVEAVRLRFDDILQARNPSDPLVAASAAGEAMRKALSALQA
jgi:NAD(P)-dependent dehydrogenase (short-subunit alcohol dehydrogenase family)